MKMPNNDFQVIKKIYLEWCKLPRSMRKPPTQAEFAEEHDVSRRTLIRWGQDPEFKQAIAENTIGYLSTEDIADIMYAMKKKAKSGSIEAARELFKMSGLYDTKLPSEVDSEDYSNLTDAELDEILDAEEAGGS